MSNESQRVLLTTKVAAANLGLPVKMPNDEFDQPVNSPWAEFFILGGKPFTVGGEGKGKKRTRYVCMVQLSVWTPAGKGTKASALAADKFGTLFENRIFRDRDGNSYKFSDAETMTPSTIQGWSAEVVRITYTRDEVKVVGITAET